MGRLSVDTSAAANRRLRSVATPDNPLWDDMRVSVARGTTGPNNPTLTAFRDGLMLYAFSKSAMNQIFFDVQMPHAWKYGSPVSPHLHWTNTSAGTGTCRWGLETTWCSYGGTWGTSSTVYAPQAAAGAYVHQIAEFPDLTATGMKASSILVCRLFRDGAGATGTDDLDEVAFAVSFDLHYQIDKGGGVTEYAGAT